MGEGEGGSVCTLVSLVCLSSQELDFVIDQSSVALNCSLDFLRNSLNAVGQDAQDSVVNTSQCE